MQKKLHLSKLSFFYESLADFTTNRVQIEKEKKTCTTKRIDKYD